MSLDQRNLRVYGLISVYQFTRRNKACLLAVLLAGSPTAAIEVLNSAVANPEPPVTGDLNATSNVASQVKVLSARDTKYVPHFPSFEIKTRDEGSLWNEGTAYDLSQPDADGFEVFDVDVVNGFACAAAASHLGLDENCSGAIGARVMASQTSPDVLSRTNAFGRMIRHVSFCALDPASIGHSYKYRERFNNAVFISPKRDFLFTKCEKCANVTMRRSLQNLVAEAPLPRDFEDIDRWRAPLLQPSDLGLWRIQQINQIAFKFAVVRNPYTRLLSYYLSAPREHFSKLLGTDERMDFATFVILTAKQQPEEMNPHWRVQYYNLFCDVIEYDRLFRFENLEEELTAFMKRYSSAPEIRSVHKNQGRAGQKLASYYTPALEKLVRETYALDFETFGYPVDLPI